jgi:ABC-type uncharacterized transport system substrate-binding protein
MARSAHVGGVFDTRRYARDRRAKVIRWLSTVGCMVTLALLLAPLAAGAPPPPKVPRIGGLSPYSSTAASRHHAAFRQGLHERGYGEGQTILLEERWAEGKLERLPDLAAELVRLPVELIVAAEGRAASAARQATERRAIVVATGDAVGTGLSTNSAQPDGNITGLATNSAELSGKWLELLKEAVPARARGGAVGSGHPDDRTGLARDAGCGADAGDTAPSAERA